jgi:hypothetical protein
MVSASMAFTTMGSIAKGAAYRWAGWYVTVDSTGGATDRPVGAKRGLIGGSVDGLHRPQQRHVGLLVMVEQLI